MATEKAWYESRYYGHLMTKQEHLEHRHLARAKLCRAGRMLLRRLRPERAPVPFSETCFLEFPQREQRHIEPHPLQARRALRSSMREIRLAVLIGNDRWLPLGRILGSIRRARDLP